MILLRFFGRLVNLLSNIQLYFPPVKIQAILFRPYSTPAYHHKENIRPSRIQRTPAEEYNIDNLGCFTFGRHGNQKVKSSGNTNPLVNKNNEKISTQYANSNANNNNVSSDQVDEESQEPIPPPRKRGGYYRSQLHSSPADLLQANHTMGQGVVSGNRTAPLYSPQHGTASQKTERLSRPIHDRNDSGFEPGSDPNSPLSPYTDALSAARHSRLDIFYGQFDVGQKFSLRRILHISPPNHQGEVHD